MSMGNRGKIWVSTDSIVSSLDIGRMETPLEKGEKHGGKADLCYIPDHIGLT